MRRYRPDYAILGTISADGSSDMPTVIARPNRVESGALFLELGLPIGWVQEIAEDGLPDSDGCLELTIGVTREHLTLLRDRLDEALGERRASIPF